jgi:hypothetical protein
MLRLGIAALKFLKENDIFWSGVRFVSKSPFTKVAAHRRGQSGFADDKSTRGEGAVKLSSSISYFGPSIKRESEVILDERQCEGDAVHHNIHHASIAAQPQVVSHARRLSAGRLRRVPASSGAISAVREKCAL